MAAFTSTAMIPSAPISPRQTEPCQIPQKASITVARIANAPLAHQQ